MGVNQLINLLATITLIEMMATIGLGVTLADVAGVVRNGRLVARAVLANYICVPAAGVALILLLHAQPMVAVGFLVAAVCPGAPYGPPFTAMARGNVVLATGLMVILAGSSAIVAPLLLKVLLPVVTGNVQLKVNVAKMISTLVLSQFLPLCAGLYVRQRYPKLATRLKKPAGQVSILLNLSLVGLIVAVQYRMLLEIREAGYLGMLALLIATVFAGLLTGGTNDKNLKGMVLTTSVRNVGVSLVIAASSFPGTPAVTATTAYALFQTIIMALVALAWGACRDRLVLKGVML